MTCAIKVFSILEFQIQGYQHAQLREGSSSGGGSLGLALRIPLPVSFVWTLAMCLWNIHTHTPSQLPQVEDRDLMSLYQSDAKAVPSQDRPPVTGATV